LGLAGAQLPLLRLPEVLEHARRGARVTVVEGEKACDALGRLGIFATTNPGGAGKWRPEHTAALQGATVLPIADCDPPGRQHALQVAGELLSAGVNTLMPLDLCERCDDGYDIVDYLSELAQALRRAFPQLSPPVLRDQLRDFLERLFVRQPPADCDPLRDRLEFTSYQADPSGRARLQCGRCGRQRVHRVSHGLAFCPCGAHQQAPA
jgi:hypothetical protein